MRKGDMEDDGLAVMSGRRILRRFSSSISDLLSIQKRTSCDDNENGTALHSAVKMGNAVMAQALLESRNVWIDEEDGRGRTALHYAMEQGSTEMASLLLKMGANVDCVDFNGTSACHLACQEGMIDNFNLLMYYHADMTAVDKTGKTPFDLACEFGQDKMVEQMINSGIDIQLLKSAGGLHKASALHIAARNGHTHIVQRLIDSGWDIDKATSMGTALHEAAGNGKAQIVRFLLHAGIDTSLLNCSGQTALEYAKKNAHRNPITIKEIRFLLKEHKNFVYAEAVKDHIGIRADELTFSVGDIIWVIDNNPKLDKHKGVIFGQRANSRSGSFDPKAVRTIERPKSMIGSMSNRMSVVSMQTFGQPQERKAKKFDIPIVPKVAVNSTKNSAVVDNNKKLNNGYRSVQSPTRLSDELNGNSRRPQHSLNSFGTDANLSYGKPVMTAVQYASTSSIPMADSHRISTGSNCSQSSGFESMKNGASTSSSASSFQAASQQIPHADGSARNGAHSSGSGSNGSGPSSLASCSVDALDESFGSASPYEASVDVTQMVSKGMQEAEILAIWLDKMHMSEYLSLFLTQGYDLSTIARITPEDLLNVGVTNPDHRKHLIVEIHTWNITDSWPCSVTSGGLRSWLEALSLPEYYEMFISQRYTTVQEVVTLAWEDLEDIGIKRLGHLKKILLAAKKIKDFQNSAQAPPEYTSASGMKFIQAPVQVYSPRLSARTSESMYADYTTNRLNDPPPPAPSSYRGGKPLTGGIDYFSYSRGSRNPPPPPPVRDEYSRCNTRNSSSSFDNYKLPEMTKREPLRLNFYNNGQILSEAKERDNISLMGSTTNLDFPPAPAPLAIDSSIKRLQDACASSASIGSLSSGGSFDMPFANENCGTIRAKDPSKSISTSSIPVPTSNPRPPILKNGSSSTSAMSTTKESVLSSMETMFNSLTAELDGMLEPYNKKNLSQS